MKKYIAVNLFLDRDSSGIKATRKAILSDSIYKDQSILYKGFKDLNDKLTGKELMHKTGKGIEATLLSFCSQLCFSFVETAGSIHPPVVGFIEN